MIGFIARLRRLDTGSFVFLALFGMALRVFAVEPAPSEGTNAWSPLYPRADAIVTNEWVQLMAVCPVGTKSVDLLWDGKPVVAQIQEFSPAWPKKFKTVSSKPPVRTENPVLDDKSKIAVVQAVVPLEVGAHVWTINGLTNHVSRFEALPTSAASNALSFSHPGSDKNGKPLECAACHEAASAGSQAKLGRVKMPDRCQTCHDPVDLRLAHSHVMEPLAKCSLCHDPHGAPQPKLLLAEPAKLCVQCHEAGHFK